jgi:tetratricopeptide (TPR) repeat protein
MDPVALGEAGTHPNAGRSSARVFVGRAKELSDLVSGLDDAAAGRGSLCLLSGEPGIGKTRLMTELGQVAGQAGFRVVAGRCWEEGGAPPYWPWIQVLRSIGGDLEDLASGSHSAGSVSHGARIPEGERIRMFDEVSRYLAGAASKRPLLVTLDDVHAADEPSLLLLRFMGDALQDARLLVVAAYRDAEPRVRELGETFAELARVGRRIPLRGLAPAEIETYVADATGGEPSDEVVAHLHQITGGNPFFVEEVVRQLAAGASLDAGGKDPLLRIPEEVRTLIRRRVASLPAEAVAVLRIAAVLGREFDLQHLQHASRLTPAGLLEVLDAAVAAGVVAEVAALPGRYSFRHELMRETLYDDLSRGRRLELHREIGRLLEQVHGDDLDPHLSEIARHLHLAAPLGDAPRALDFLVRAGDRASALFAYEEAAAHYRRAVELLPMVEGTSGERRAELLLGLGEAQWRSGNGPAARITFEQAIEESRRLGNAELLAGSVLGYVTALGGFLLYARFEVGEASVGLLEEALAALPPEDSSLRAHMLAHLALEMWSANVAVAERVAVSDQAIGMARRLGDSEALVTALHARHWTLTTPGMARERLAHSEEMLRVAKETNSPEIEFLAHNARFHCFLELCDRRGMEAEGAAMTGLAERLRQPFYRWHSVCVRTLHATLDGRFPEAERLAQEALELGRLRQSEYATYVFRYAQMFAIRWAQGRLSEVWPGHGGDAGRFHEERFPWIPRWRYALGPAELGDVQTARDELDRYAAEGFERLPRDGLWILHVASLGEACVLAGDVRRAEELYELLLPHADDNAVSYTQQPFGPVALRLGMLAALLGRWPDADAHFATALARCELLGARPIRARTLIEYATVLARRGEPADRGRLEGLLDEAAHLCAELDVPELAARVEALRGRPEGADGAPGAVFRREGELWTLAWDGQTVRLRDVKGLRYIAVLLAGPGREFHVAELVGGAAGHPAETPASAAAAGLTVSLPADSGPVLDAEAKESYRRRLAELDDELEEARSWNDHERTARLAGERDFIASELGRAVGLGERDRSFASPEERARVSVTKAIRTAIRLVQRECPELGEHLESSIRTGRFCSYTTPGAAPPTWSL